MSNDITGGLRNLKGGSIDSLRGPYTTVAAANLAIPNTIVDGVNFREGKFAEVGTVASGFVTYWWKGGYADTNLVEYFIDDKLIVKKSDITYKQDLPIDKVSIIDRGFIVKGFHNVAGGVYNTTNNTNNWIRYPLLSLKTGNQMLIEGTGITSGTVLAAFVDDNLVLKGSITGNGSNSQIVTAPEGATQIGINIASSVNIAISPNPTENLYAISAKAYRLVLSTGITEIDGIKIEASFLKEGITYDGEISNPKSPITREYFEGNLPRGNKFFDGYGFPYNTSGDNGDKYIDLKTGRLFIKKDGEWGVGVPIGGRDQFFIYPSDFSFRPGNIIKSSSGHYIPPVADIQSFAQKDIDTLRPYYVDPVNGISSNNGITKMTAVKSVANAIAKGARLIKLLPGFYGRNEQMGVIVDVNVNTPFIMMADEPNTVAFGYSDNANTFTWTAEDNVFKTTRTGVYNVVDTSTRVSDGYFKRYSKVSSIALVKSSPYSWFQSGSLIYINNNTLVQPSNNINLVYYLTTCQYYPSANIPYVYFFGIHFYGANGQGQLNIRNNTTTQFNTKSYVKDCKFVDNSMGNGLAIDNLKEAWIQNCGGVGALRDTLNYHTSLLSSGYQKMNIVQIDGESKDTGIGSIETSSNGSTAHEGASIIRFGGDFSRGRGPLVVDVNDGTKSINFNVTASSSILDFTGSFQVDGIESKMWLFGCYAYGSKRAAVATAPAKIFFDSETVLDGDLIGEVVRI